MSFSHAPLRALAFISFCVIVVFCVELPMRVSAISTTQQTAPAFDQWGDEFDGDKLDETKWERYHRGRRGQRRR
ncbi:MAG: hypothetical protein H0T63_09375 [Pyrinomonadaceae bacterium]|jgi:hypothetical protein|nr:hypothetical protein [Pyrinomonadaceae bacterium]